MRMWMVPPELMCRRHLLGEHNELHMLAGSLMRGRHLDGFLAKRLLEPSALRERHEALAAEMTARGYRHASPLPEFETALSHYPDALRIALAVAAVNPDQSRRELASRCPDCARRLAEEPSES